MVANCNKAKISGKNRDKNFDFCNNRKSLQNCFFAGPIPQKLYANLSKSVVCVLQPEFGDCYDYQPS